MVFNKKMRKDLKRITSGAAAALLLLSLCLTGCSGRPEAVPDSTAAGSTEAYSTAADSTEADSTKADSTAAETTAVTFTDALGREVTVSEANRVAVLIGSFADIWCLAGGKDSIIAAANDTWTSFDLGLSDQVVNLGAIKEPNLEQLVASEPDLVIASSNTDADVKLLDTFETLGMNVAYFCVSSFSEYLNMLDICTQITGRRDCYEQYGTALQQQIDRAKAACDGSSPTVLYIRATGSSCKVKNSKDNVLGEMLSDLGCINIADSNSSLLESLSLEAILEMDPQYIFLVLQGADSTAAEETLEKNLLSNPAWQSLTAVKEGRCFYMDDKLYNLKPNARWGEAYEKLAEILYPAVSP